MTNNKESIHIRMPNERVREYVVYELWDGDVYIASAFGPAAVATLGTLALNYPNIRPGQLKGCDLIFVDEPISDCTKNDGHYSQSTRSQYEHK